MRVCVDSDDDYGFRQFQEARRRGVTYDVLLDGNPISDVLMADDELGEVVRHKRDAAGKWVQIKVHGHWRIVREELYGTVTLIERQRG